MKVKEIQIMAQTRGLKPAAKLTKAGLIRLIQKEEGSSECYATSVVVSCAQNQCLWRQDCLKTA